VAYQDVATHPGAETFPGLLIIRFDADLFFANATVFADHVTEAVSEAEIRPSVVLIDAEAISDADSTALLVVRDLRDELADQGIELWTARVKSRVAEGAGRVEGVEADTVYPTVRSAVAAFEARAVAGEPAESDAAGDLTEDR
jgi:MFS superfamily sulfate permease-like transporter